MDFVVKNKLTATSAFANPWATEMKIHWSTCDATNHMSIGILVGPSAKIVGTTTSDSDSILESSEGGTYYHVYSASAAHKTALINASTAKEVDVTFTHMKLQCIFVSYPTNRAENKKVVEIRQQRVESPLKRWHAICIHGFSLCLTRKEQLKLLLYPSIITEHQCYSLISKTVSIEFYFPNAFMTFAHSSIAFKSNSRQLCPGPTSRPPHPGPTY
eukprot:14412098-Ditylum_brightwellii.AAC.1